MTSNYQKINYKTPSFWLGTNWNDVDLLVDELERKHSNSLIKREPEISLIDYIKQAWKVIEPGKQLVSNWSIEAISDHLEAVSKGEITRLIINVPPRHTKSLICSVFWPSWEWHFNPSSQWLTISYGLKLAIKFANKSRRLINSKWYKGNWGKVFKLAGDQNVKSFYENNFEGARLATAMLAAVTGENADRIVIDDPHNVQEAESETVRDAVIEAFDQAISTRLNDSKKGAIVLIAQRVHEKDLSGHLLAEGGWEHLCLPTEFDSTERCKTSIGFVDPRVEDGQLLWPERFDKQVIEKAKKTLGIYGYSAQHQQKPVPRKGGLFKEEDFRLIERSGLPMLKRRHRHWDLAATDSDTAAYTAGLLMGVDLNGRYYILDVVRDQLSPGDVETLIKHTAVSDGYDVSITLEQEKGSAGKHVTDYYRRNLLKGFDCKPQPLWGDKITRANAVAAQVEYHNVYLVESDWNQSFLAEACKFPKSTYKDQVDALSGAFRELCLAGIELPLPEVSHEPKDLYA